MTKWLWVSGGLFFLLFFALLMIFSGQSTEETTLEKPSPDEHSLVLATTTSTYDTGLLDELIPAFEEHHQHDVDVRVIAVGTGQALQLGRDGNADVVLVHARDLEDQFMEEGYGEYPFDVMYNRFMLVGPADDPADIQGEEDVVQAFLQLAEQEATFISRGDESGTHHKELDIWDEVKQYATDNVEGMLQGQWYHSVGQGMGSTLQMANELDGYTLTDEATYFMQPYELEVIVEEDEQKRLHNPYGMMVVQSTLHQEWAYHLVDFFVGEKGQAIIESFGYEQFGKPIFTPDAQKRSYD